MTDPTPRIRNFSIIAHIDHGKSTLADRLLQATNAVSAREAREQMLDSMDLERERGITIKASAVTVMHRHVPGTKADELEADYEEPTDEEGRHRTRKGSAEEHGELFMLNFIDTPGHVDFNYEVSRALKACEGALLVVDATQGVEAQTVVNALLAIGQDLEIIPVLNKIDLPSARADEVAMEVEQVLGFAAEDCLLVSAKTGEGIRELLAAICERLPGPRPPQTRKTRALIFDAVYDDYRGVIVYVRVFDGRLRVGEKVRMMGLGRTHQVTELGKYTPKALKVQELGPGETGYLVAAIKTLGDVRVGDTITLELDPAEEPLEGYQPPRQMVFCDFYPATSEKKGNDFEELREAMEKLSLNDSSFTFQAVHSEALGFGFRCGFLGLLHMEIVQERLRREFDMDIIATYPSVVYRVRMTDGTEREVDNPALLPDVTYIDTIFEPMVKTFVICPGENIGDLMGLISEKRGVIAQTETLDARRVMMTCRIPMNEILIDFHDRIKSITRGYGSMDYEPDGYEASEMVKLDMMVNGEVMEAFSSLVHRSKAEHRGRLLAAKLRDVIPRQQFQVAIQAAIGGKIIARETVSALRKDVTAKCYGGDIT
ncbi:MAG: translation elongation factor 4, partial [Phycisphaeraceae bacterium]|nr:translation elongation factor 4 [Phycisphaeraceae bacterium]